MWVNDSTVCSGCRLIADGDGIGSHLMQTRDLSPQRKIDYGHDCFPWKLPDQSMSKVGLERTGLNILEQRKIDRSVARRS